jgi:hypothetical protein
MRIVGLIATAGLLFWAAGPSEHSQVVGTARASMPKLVVTEDRQRFSVSSVVMATTLTSKAGGGARPTS